MTELQHNGVKGMRWGVRKAPSSAAPPSATSARKTFGGPNVSVALQRKIVGGVKASNANRKGKKAQAATKATSLQSKVHKMSDAELKEKIARMRLEKDYIQLTQGDGAKKVSKGRKVAQDLLADTAKSIAKEQAKKYALKGIEAGVKAALASAAKK